jgi:MinD-like ATPase involved in chromosome partitioning or flagellar assembly
VYKNKVFLIAGNAGQGKSTVAKNLAFALRMFGFDVLLVDADLKTPKLGYHVGMPIATKTIQDVLLGHRSLEDAIYQRSSGLKLLLSSLIELDCPHPSKLLPELKRLAQVVIIDVPNYDRQWFETKEPTIFVTQPDFPSILEVQKLCKLANVHGIVINRTHSDGVDLSPGNIQQLVTKQIIGMIPEEPIMREALRHGYSLIEFHPELQASIALKQLAAKLMNLEYSAGTRAPSLLAKLGLT